MFWHNIGKSIYFKLLSKVIKICNKDLLCSNGFENIWKDQSVVNGKLFLASFEQRLEDTHIQKCIGDMNSSKKCRTYREIKLFTSVKVIWIAILDTI